MFSIDMQGGREWVWAPGKNFSGPPAKADQLNVFYTIIVLMCQKNKHTMSGTKIKHDIGVENVCS